MKITELKSADKTLWQMRLKAREEGRRLDAQTLADAQFLIREEMKRLNRKKIKV